MYHGVQGSYLDLAALTSACTDANNMQRLSNVLNLCLNFSELRMRQVILCRY